MGQVVLLADVANDNRFISVREMLEEAVRDSAAGKIAGKKAILLLLDQGEDLMSYSVGFRCAGMKTSEIVALLEIQAQQFKNEILK